MDEFCIDNWMDDLNDYVFEETGNDDMVYGNYIDWDSFRSDHADELLQYFDVYLPWGESLSIEDYYLFINQDIFKNTHIFDEWNLNVASEDEDEIQPSKVSDIIIEFPEQINEICSEILDYYNVPSGYVYESGGEPFPEEFKYYQQEPNDDDYFDFEYYINNPTDFEKYDDTISNIEIQLSKNSNELIKKALILSSCIITENLLKSRIINNIPTEEHINEQNKKLINMVKEKMIYRGNINQRALVFKNIFHEKIPNQNWLALRNALAHDIGEVKINKEKIEYKDKKQKKTISNDINKIFSDQKLFGQQLKNIELTNQQKK